MGMGADLPVSMLRMISELWFKPDTETCPIQKKAVAMFLAGHIEVVTDVKTMM